MVTIRREARLEAPTEQVWEIASPPSGWADWLSLHASWPKAPPTEVAVGTTFIEKVVLLNIPMPMTWRITEFAAPSAFAMSGQSVMGVGLDIRFELTPAEGATDVVVTAGLSGALVMGGLKNVVHQYADTHLELSLAKLTSLLS
ncbi:SRPBCC family protein [Nocardioides cavernaquae]|uniref:SRPBCC family protein n=1 Tax=Nocardioides cavernaquae TaxID=2321396 RepID=A0A3A5H953_9ACTN|nr:SRPBCC family protein [Nocardioides cavernaquae]RJS47189.1 SRPBCC family protein [Nocardioides cavernaquae]